MSHISTVFIIKFIIAENGSLVKSEFPHSPGSKGAILFLMNMLK